MPRLRMCDVTRDAKRMRVEQTGRSKDVRHRSLPTSRPFTVAVFFAFISYLGIVATLTAFVIAFVYPSQFAVSMIVGGIIFTGIAWLIAFFRRRTAHCPLCKGTPLINSGALVHSKATRIFPLNHGVSSIISVLALQRFRCMYCGSDFDLLKPPSHRLIGGQEHIHK